MLLEVNIEITHDKMLCTSTAAVCWPCFSQIKRHKHGFRMQRLLGPFLAPFPICHLLSEKHPGETNRWQLTNLSLITWIILIWKFLHPSCTFLISSIVILPSSAKLPNFLLCCDPHLHIKSTHVTTKLLFHKLKTNDSDPLWCLTVCLF